MKKLVSSIIIFIAIITHSLSALSEPYLAVKTGMKCSGCHVNPIGGGKRNTFGSIYGQTGLTQKSATTMNTPIVDLGDLNKSISLGGDLRSALQYTNSDSGDELTFNTQSGQLYIEVAPANSAVTFYLDEQIAPSGALSRESFMLLKNQSKDLYLKVGKIMTPFGHRIEDDTAFIRQATGINFDNSDNGVEVGYDTKNTFTTLTVTNGTGAATDSDRNKQIIARSEYYQSNWRVGSSMFFNSSDEGNKTMTSLFGGARYQSFVLLVEVDHINDRSVANVGEQQTALIELNYGFNQGNNFKYTYEFFDPDMSVDENQRTRNSVVWEHTPKPYLQFRSGIRFAEGVPQAASQNTTEGFLQVHAYF